VSSGYEIEKTDLKIDGLAKPLFYNTATVWE
jgi:hypothetical protein